MYKRMIPLLLILSILLVGCYPDDSTEPPPNNMELADIWIIYSTPGGNISFSRSLVTDDYKVNASIRVPTLIGSFSLQFTFMEEQEILEKVDEINASTNDLFIALVDQNAEKTTVYHLEDGNTAKLILDGYAEILFDEPIRGIRTVIVDVTFVDEFTIECADCPELQETILSEDSTNLSLDISIITNAANVRTGPSTDYPVIEAYPKGTVFEVVEQDLQSGWYKVRLDNGEFGWISNSIANPIQSNDANLSATEDDAEIETSPVSIAESCLPTIEGVTARPPTADEDQSVRVFLQFAVNCTEEILVAGNPTNYPESNEYAIWDEGNFWTIQARQGNKCDIKSYSIVPLDSGGFDIELYVGEGDPSDALYACKF